MDIQEKIDAYFGGTLSADEMRELESAVSENPELQKEFQFQNDISEAFKELRIAELKAHLNTVSVTPNPFDYALIKIFSGIVIVTGISIIGYFMLPKSVENEPIINDTALQTESPVVAEPLEKQDKPVSDEKPSQADKTVAKSSKESTKNVEPKPVKPNIIEDFDDTETTDVISAPENDALENSTFSNSAFEVEIKSSQEYTFHYKFLGNRLFLYGDFTEEPYNIIEFKSDTTSQFFFSFQNHYYALERSNNQITPLSAITDSELITQLNSLGKDN